MNFKHVLLVVSLAGITQPAWADIADLFKNISSGLSSATDNNESAPKGKGNPNKEPQGARLRNTDPYCLSPEESYSLLDNVTSISVVAVQLGLAGLLSGGQVDKKKSMSALRAYSKEHLWLPTQVEDLYGIYQHKQRVADGLVIFREDANKTEQASYARADRIFNNLMRYAPEKMPYEMKLYIVNTPGVNAEAVPGGYVYISKDTLTKYPKDDSMATFMLGHEIAHVSKRHLSKQFQERLVDSGAALQLFQTLLGKGDHGNPLVTLLAAKSFYEGLQGIFAKYDSEQELEADACAVNFSYSVNSDPLKGYTEYSKFHSRVNSKTAKKSAGVQSSEHPNDRERSNSAHKVVAYYKKMRAQPGYKPPEPHKYAQATDGGSGQNEDSPDFLTKIKGFFTRDSNGTSGNATAPADAGNIWNQQ